MRIYLVGGAVRDMLLGRERHDGDFVVVGATVEEFRRRFPRARAVGKSFPVFLLGRDQYALCRAGDIEADLLARDLTVNALALDESGEITAHPKALSDLRRRVLRPASERAFIVDPLRVFRAARFYAAWPEFTAHAELKEVMRRTARAGLLEGVAPERVGVETRKALAGPRPGRFLSLLSEAECLWPWFKEFAGSAQVPAGPAPYHTESLLGHTLLVMDRLAGSELGVWMGLCHDLGKGATPSEYYPHHYGHEKAGGPLAARLGKRLALPEKFIRAGAMAAEWHMKAGRYPELRPGTKVDLLMRLHAKGLVTEMFNLVYADQGTDFRTKVQRDLSVVLSVRLPEQDRDQGPASGEKLRLRRCQALAGVG